MQTLPLPFGASGLDRYTGEMAVRPGSLRDARNVYLRGSRIEARRGMSVTGTLPQQGGEDASHVVLLEALTFERAAVAVGYYPTSRELHLYRLTGDGDTPTHIGALFTLNADAVTPPRLHAAESAGMLFIAHDEPLQSKRAATHVYDPLGATALYELEAELDAAGEAPVRFRGVLAWRDYIVGWGFASATSARPEVVRVSLPGQPLRWDPDHYFIAGTRGDPVLSCRPAGGHLLAMKASQTHRIHGSSHLDFGILPLHALTGALGHALTIEIDGRCYAWSAEGPVLLTGAVEPGELETPLDLEGPQPDGFEDLDFATGYAQYLHGRRVVEWVYGGQSFCFDLRTQQWSYGESDVERYAGALLYSGASLADELDDAPTGFPANVAATPGATVATIAWDNSGADGNETAEVWLRPSGGDWSLAAQEPVSGASQEATVGEDDPLTFPEDYDVAVRFRRGGRYTSGYEGTPDTWPATSQDNFTTQLEAPTLDSVTWERTSSTSERARIEFTAQDPGVSHDILRDDIVIATLDPGEDLYDDTGITGESNHTYEVRAVEGVHESALSNSITTWMGPDAQPSNATWDTDGLADPNVLIEWTNGDATLATRILEDDVEQSEEDPGETSTTLPLGHPPGTIDLQHVEESFGVKDYGPLVGATEKPA